MFCKVGNGVRVWDIQLLAVCTCMVVRLLAHGMLWFCFGVSGTGGRIVATCEYICKDANKRIMRASPAPVHSEFPYITCSDMCVYEKVSVFELESGKMTKNVLNGERA